MSPIITVLKPASETIRSTVAANLKRWKEAPTETKVSIVVSIFVATGMLYFRSTALLSQASTKRARSKPLLELIREGVVFGVFTYEGTPFPDSASFSGRFIRNLQPGTCWDTDIREWTSCLRRIVGVDIDGSFVSTPRSVLRGLLDGSLGTLGDKIVINPRVANVTGFPSDLNNPLESQASRPRKKQGQNGMDLRTSSKQSAPQTTISIDAGAHHLNRHRVAVPTASPFDMNKIFYDSKTVEADKKFLKVKFTDAMRNQFATSGGAPIATQLAGLTQTMREARITTDMGGGIFQEETKLVPIEEEVDESVV